MIPESRWFTATKVVFCFTSIMLACSSPPHVSSFWDPVYWNRLIWNAAGHLDTEKETQPVQRLFLKIFLLRYNFHNHKCTLSKCTIQSVRFSRSVVSDSLEPMNCSTSGFHVHHQLPELEQTHIHPVSDAIQASHLLLPPSPPAFSFSQHWGLF